MSGIRARHACLEKRHRECQKMVPSIKKYATKTKNSVPSIHLRKMMEDVFTKYEKAAGDFRLTLNVEEISHFLEDTVDDALQEEAADTTSEMLFTEFLQIIGRMNDVFFRELRQIKAAIDVTTAPRRSHGRRHHR